MTIPQVSAGICLKTFRQIPADTCGDWVLLQLLHCVAGEPTGILAQPWVIIAILFLGSAVDEEKYCK
jgi:hypothetical protein